MLMTVFDLMINLLFCSKRSGSNDYVRDVDK